MQMMRSRESIQSSRSPRCGLRKPRRQPGKERRPAAQQARSCLNGNCEGLLCGVEFSVRGMTGNRGEEGTGLPDKGLPGHHSGSILKARRTLCYS